MRQVSGKKRKNLGGLGLVLLLALLIFRPLQAEEAAPAKESPAPFAADRYDMRGAILAWSQSLQNGRIWGGLGTRWWRESKFGPMIKQFYRARAAATRVPGPLASYLPSRTERNVTSLNLGKAERGKGAEVRVDLGLDLRSIGRGVAFARDLRGLSFSFQRKGLWITGYVGQMLNSDIRACGLQMRLTGDDMHRPYFYFAKVRRGAPGSGLGQCYYGVGSDGELSGKRYYVERFWRNVFGQGEKVPAYPSASVFGWDVMTTAGGYRLTTEVQSYPVPEEFQPGQGNDLMPSNFTFGTTPTSLLQTPITSNLKVTTLTLTSHPIEKGEEPLRSEMSTTLTRYEKVDPNYPSGLPSDRPGIDLGQERSFSFQYRLFSDLLFESIYSTFTPGEASSNRTPQRAARLTVRLDD